MSDMADMAIFPRSLLRKFILQYKDLPCLWDRNCPAYKHKLKRHEAISKLTELLQQHFPRATRVHVLRKIESLRACVRREYKRVLDSRAKASNPDEVYTPQLWYYELCLFMFGEDGNNYQGRREVTDQNAESEEETPGCLEEEDEMPFEKAMESFSEEFKASANVVEAGDSTSDQKQALDDEEDAESNESNAEPIDHFDAIGIYLAAKLRVMSPRMRIHAEKMINEIVYRAQMNLLTPDLVLGVPDRAKQA